jgi:peptidyl-prolyl cis-trans isomerase D
VIRLDDIRAGTQRPFEEVHEELAADMRRDRAQSIFYERSQQLADESFAALSELESVAQKLGLSLRTVEGFTREGGGPFGTERKVIDAAFGSDVLVDRQNSAPISLGDDRVVVLRVTAHEESRQQPLADVRGVVEGEARADMARKAAIAAADAARSRLKDGAAWAEVVQGLGATAAGQVTVTRRTQEYPPELLAAVFTAAAPDGARPSVGQALLASGDPVLFIVNARRPGAVPAEDGAGQLANESRAVASMAGATEFAAYLAEVERAAKIKRNDKAFE